MQIVPICWFAELLSRHQRLGLGPFDKPNCVLSNHPPIELPGHTDAGGKADQACPMFPGQVNRHHWGFDDPAHATGTDDEKLSVFRRVRDEIRRVFDAYAAGRLDVA